MLKYCACDLIGFFFSFPFFFFSFAQIELRTLDGLVKDRTQCAPNGYYFIPVYDKVFRYSTTFYLFFSPNLLEFFFIGNHVRFLLQGSFVIQINGPKGWSWDPDKVLAFTFLLIFIQNFLFGSYNLEVGDAGIVET